MSALQWNLPVTVGQFPQLLPVAGSSTVAAGSMTATLAGATGKLTYIEGFDVTGGNATVAGTINITVTGLPVTLNFALNVLSSDTTTSSAGSGQLSVRFPTPLPALASNTGINVIVPSMGSGNAAAAVAAYGLQSAALAQGQS